MNIEVTRINSGIRKSPQEYIRSVNEDYLFRLGRIADDIVASRDEKPVILLAGPSGSGKTTTAMMLAKMLEERGSRTHTLSMDNYFCSLTEEEKSLSALGKIDLESPLRVDKEFLNRQIEAISSCKEIKLPKYNFKTSSRESSGRKFVRQCGELVIFEGIHALNPDVITVPDSKICKIYISVRTRVTDGNVILHPSRIRLLRRMIRDRKFRQRSLMETMNMFHSVENGENKYIMPYKDRSDYDVDTFMSYELNVYRSSLIDELREMSDIPEIRETLEILEALEPLDAAEIPSDSLICEFIGNGQFKY